MLNRIRESNSITNKTNEHGASSFSQLVSGLISKKSRTLTDRTGTLSIHTLTHSRRGLKPSSLIAISRHSGIASCRREPLRQHRLLAGQPLGPDVWLGLALPSPELHEVPVT